MKEESRDTYPNRWLFDRTDTAGAAGSGAEGLGGSKDGRLSGERCRKQGREIIWRALPEAEQRKLPARNGEGMITAPDTKSLFRSRRHLLPCRSP